MHAAKIIADSISPDCVRLTTMEVVMPRIILAEFNTHRMFSRNSASSRAIPVEKMLKMVQENPYIPIHWGKNQKGMQADQEVNELDAKWARQSWLWARDNAVQRANELLNVGIHKQITNRLLEPFMWHTVIVTATEWSNFFHLRNHEAAHPDMRLVARAMQFEYEKDINGPEYVDYGEWHLPYITLEEENNYTQQSCIEASIMRCARVSYLTHEGGCDIEADSQAYQKRLLAPGHMSPLEHPATPIAKVFGAGAMWSGNFRGWKQYRKTIEGEADIFGHRKNNAKTR